MTHLLRLRSLLNVTVLIISVLIVTNATVINWKAHSKHYGEPCVNNDECVDFRMICSKNAICECDKFHNWTEINAFVSECVANITSLRDFLSKEHERSPTHEEKLSYEAHNLFVYLGLAGIVAISFGILLAFACVIFVFAS